MKEWLRRQWHDYYKLTYRIFAFLITGIIILLSFPSMGRFNYDYELQRPWSHEDLKATFNFPIYKTEAELDIERDSIKSKFRPYYHRDSIVGSNSKELSINIIQLSNNKINTICPSDLTDSIKNYLTYRLEKVFNEVYAKGIIELPEDIDNSQKENYELMLISGNIVEPYELSEFFTLREAYSYVCNDINTALMRRYGNDNNWISQLVERMPINDKISSNIIYEKERSDIELTNELINISAYSDKIQIGQSIIKNGDIVNKRNIKLLDSLKKFYENQNTSTYLGLPIYIGEALIVYSLLITVFLFLYFFRRDIFQQLHCINFILLLMILMVICAGIISRHHGNISFVMPYVILPIILRIFLDSRLAMYVHTITILLISFMASNSQQFILIHIPAGMIAIISLINMSRRGQIVRTSIMVFGSYIMIYIGYGLWQIGEFENSINMNVLLMFALNAALILFSYPAIYIFERLFGFLSDVTLMELSDTNHPLLRELSEKAPGTFQHSVQVGNLAQDVAYKIGANAMLVRAGAMYHDIGKIVSPMYFTENQAGNINPHDDIDIQESAKIVISHVSNGVKIARKHKIPQQIIDIIQCHHGDSQARYFYVTYCNLHPDEEVDKSAFSYPGPVPTTKEETLVMMADAIEASAKSLTTYTDETIGTLVEKIITMQTENKLFRDAQITFKDIETAKAIFKEKLKNIYHGRIQYPELLK